MYNIISHNGMVTRHLPVLGLHTGTSCHSNCVQLRTLVSLEWKTVSVFKPILQEYLFITHAYNYN